MIPGSYSDDNGMAVLFDLIFYPMKHSKNLNVVSLRYL